MHTVFSKHFDTTQIAASAVLDAVRPTLQTVCHNPDDANLAVTEAVVNVVDHDAKDHNAGGLIEISHLDASTIVCKISDLGEQFSIAEHLPGWSATRDAPENSVGILLMASLADSLTLSSDGTGKSLKMIFPARCTLVQ